jgi:hypothetical protein
MLLYLNKVNTVLLMPSIRAFRQKKCLFLAHVFPLQYDFGVTSVSL